MRDFKDYSTIAIERPESEFFWCESFRRELDNAVKSALKLGICIYVRGVVADGRDPKVLRIHVSEECQKYEGEIVKLKEYTTKYTKQWIANVGRAA